jgi:hypothetical protein
VGSNPTPSVSIVSSAAETYGITFEHNKATKIRHRPPTYRKGEFLLVARERTR